MPSKWGMVFDPLKNYGALFQADSLMFKSSGDAKKVVLSLTMTFFLKKLHNCVVVSNIFAAVLTPLGVFW